MSTSLTIRTDSGEFTHRSASELRAIGKARGLKGNALTKHVEEHLRAQQPASDAAIAHLGRNGYLVKSMTSSKSGMVTVKYQPPRKVAASKVTALESEIAQLKALLAKAGVSTAAPATVEVPATVA
jgi:hypothetical protein